MNIEFRKSFEKDLGSIRNTILLQRIRAVIEELDTAENLSEVTNIKKLKGDGGLLSYPSRRLQNRYYSK